MPTLLSTSQKTKLSERISVAFLTIAIAAAGIAAFFSIFFTTIRFGPQPPQQLIGPYPAVLDFEDWPTGDFCLSGPGCVLNRSFVNSKQFFPRDGSFINPWKILDQGGNHVLEARWQYQETDAAFIFDPDNQWLTPYFRMSLDFKLSPTWRGGLRGGGKHIMSPRGPLDNSQMPWFRPDFAEFDRYEFDTNTNTGHWLFEHTMSKIDMYVQGGGYPFGNTCEDVNEPTPTCNPNSPAADNCCLKVFSWDLGNPESRYPYNPPNSCAGDIDDNACMVPGQWYTWDFTTDCSGGLGAPATAEFTIYQRGETQPYRHFTRTLNNYERYACVNARGINEWKLGNYDYYKICEGGLYPGKPCFSRDDDCPPGDANCIHRECRHPDHPGQDPEDNGTCTGQDPLATPNNTWWQVDNIRIEDLRGVQTNQPPTARITNPAPNSTVSGTVSVTATASDTDGTIQRVDFYLDGGFQNSDPSFPYSWSWNTTGLINGSPHTLRAISIDDDNASSPIIPGQNEITVTVQNGGQQSQTLFSDNFNDGNVTDWQTEFGAWSVVGVPGAYAYRGAPAGAGDSNPRTAWVQNQTFTPDEFFVLTKGRLETASGDQIGVTAYRTSSTNQYRFFYAKQPNELYLVSPGEQDVVVNAQNLNLNLTLDHWIKLTLRRSGTSLVLEGRIWPVDGGTEPATPQITRTDTSPLAQGTAGLHCRNSLVACRFDDFAVQTPGAQTPPGGSPVFLKSSPVFLKIEPDQNPDEGIPQD